MARDGAGTYTHPAGTTAVSGTTIDSADYNAMLTDVAAALNEIWSANIRSADKTGADADLVTGTAGQSGSPLTWNVDGDAVEATTLLIPEQTAAVADVAAYGQLWVKNDTPNTLYFTDDAGTDFQLATLAGTETLSNKTLTSPTINTPTLILPDANGAAPTTDGEIKYDRTADTLEVGDGVGTTIWSPDDVTSGIHGVTGNIVGDSDTQTLSNKTLSAPAITGTVTGAGTFSKDMNPTTDSTYDLGSSSLAWAQAYIDTYFQGTNEIKGIYRLLFEEDPTNYSTSGSTLVNGNYIANIVTPTTSTSHLLCFSSGYMGVSGTSTGTKDIRIEAFPQWYNGSTWATLGSNTYGYLNNFDVTGANWTYRVPFANVGRLTDTLVNGGGNWQYRYRFRNTGTSGTAEMLDCSSILIEFEP